MISLVRNSELECIGRRNQRESKIKVRGRECYKCLLNIAQTADKQSYQGDIRMYDICKIRQEEHQKN